MNRAIVLIVGIVVLLSLSMSPAHAASITVDPAGGPGVETSINAAIARASAGDSVFVHSGTYCELVHVNRSITLIGMDTGSGMPIVDGAGYRGIEITAGHVRVSGFDVRNCSTGILVEGLFDHSITGITVSDNTVSRASGTGIKVEYAGGQTIAGNTISESGTGIGFYQSDGNTITGNTVFSVTISGISVSYTGYTVTGNNVHHCRAAGIIVGGSGNSIRDNTVTDNGEGIMLLSCLDNEVTGNTARGNGDGLYLQDAHDNQITGNTVTGNTRGLWLTSSRNNNFADSVISGNAEDVSADDTLDQNTFSPLPGSATPVIATPTPAAGGSTASERGNSLMSYVVVGGVAVIVLGAISIGVLLVLIISSRIKRREKPR